jgi:hypothetical protein
VTTQRKPWFYAMIKFPLGNTSGIIVPATSLDEAQKSAASRAKRQGGTVVSVEKYDTRKHLAGSGCCGRRR